MTSWPLWRHLTCSWQLNLIDRSHDLLLHADWSICTTWPKCGFLIGLYRSVPHYYYGHTLLRDEPLEKWWGWGSGGGGGKNKKNSCKGKCQEKNSCKEEGKEKKFMPKEGPIVTFWESPSLFQNVWVSEINNMNKQKSLSPYWKETIRTLFWF